MAVSKPKTAEGNYKEEVNICCYNSFARQNKWNEFSIIAGYYYKADSNPEITIGDSKFQLFTSGSRAWSFSPQMMKK